jgi:diaminopimelate epimerase
MIAFSKLSGGGNDFIALIEPERDPARDQIVAWCRRGTSLGADGLFLLDRAAGGVRMRHFNSDGRPAALCLNGTRCAARLAFELGWAREATCIETDSGTFEAREAGADEVELDLPAPTGSPTTVALPVDGSAWTGWYLDVGVPHLVLPWERPLGEAPLATVGPRLRSHASLGEAGANVSFVVFSGPREISLRTYERGVEAETLACGSAVLAAVAVALSEGRAILPVVAMTQGGFAITVAAAAREGFWSMRGDARLVARGTLEAGAAGAPRSPDW